MKPIGLIASDLDGTLLRADGTVSGRTRDAILAVQSAGVTFAFVTARPPRHVQDVAESAGVSGVAVCSNGATLYHIGERVTLYREVLAPDIAHQVLKALRAKLPELAFAAEYGDSILCDPRFAVRPGHSSLRAGNIEDCLGENLLKLLVQYRTRECEAVAAAVANAIGDLAEVVHSGGHEFVEIAPAGVSKATGLQRLCSGLGIDRSEVMAFGDMPNDVPMLRFAGRAVAVANAHREVLAIADECTASNEEDGVARRIEELLRDASVTAGRRYQSVAKSPSAPRKRRKSLPKFEGLSRSDLRS